MGTPASFAHLKELFESSTRGHAQDETQIKVEGKMWNEYMKEAKTYDERDADSWKEDANGLLVFTGLFSATVGAFIIEFYKRLSPPDNTQVNLLCQISQQLPNSPNGNCTQPQLSSPPVSIILVNSMWIMSLILSLTSALFATLLQQWARRYVQMPGIPSEPTHCARVRSFLFFGIRKFHMRTAVEAAPTLLHLSVFLFFVGLVILFYDIHTTVAIIVTISVSIFVVAYLALTILPCIYHNCPYRTPMSNIWWYASHLILLSTSFCFYRLFRRLHGWLVRPRIEGITSNLQRILISGLNTFDGAVKKHRNRLKHSFRETIVNVNLRPSDTTDLEALTWWLERPALVEEGRAQEFLSSLPEKTAVKLMHDPKTRPIFNEHLLNLLRRSRPSLLPIGLNDKESKTRLLVYLQIIHCIAHDFVTHRYIEQYSDDYVNFVWSKFAEISHMREMWADDDARIRVTSRSICALLARSLLKRGLLGAPELGWLEVVVEESSNTIFDADITGRDGMNLKAFVYGVTQGGDLVAKQNATLYTEILTILEDAGTQEPFNRWVFWTRLTDLVKQIELDDQQSDLTKQSATLFTETLAILMGLGTQRPFDKTRFRQRLFEEIQTNGTTGNTEVVAKLHQMFDNI